MGLPYEDAQSGEKALTDIQKILRAFGCTRFGSMVDEEKHELLVQFSYRGRDVTVTASAAGYAAAWLKAHPYTSRTRGSLKDHELRAMKIANVAIYSVLRTGSRARSRRLRPTS